jgi:hypothetical protein
MKEQLMKDNRFRSTFYTRGFTTFVLAMSSLVIAGTGIALFVTPRGRVAHWTDWTLLGLGKDQWSSVHLTAAALFLFAALLHLVFNWKVLKGYIKLRKVTGLRLKRELVAAAVVSLLFVMGTLAQVPPFSTLVDLHHEARDYWERTSVRAPAPHAEELRLSALAHSLELSAEDVVTTLEAKGLTNVEPDMSLARIAHANAVTPAAIYERLKLNHESRRRDSAVSVGPRMGRMTLGEYCRSQGLSLDAAMATLREAGASAHESSSLRDLAGSLGMRPGELARQLDGQDWDERSESVRSYCDSPYSSR